MTFKVAAPIKCTVSISLTGLKAGVLKRAGASPSRARSSRPTTPRRPITIQRKVGTKWVKAKTVVRPVNATSGAYSYVYKPLKKGAYRVKTSVAKTALFTTATTAYKTFKVK